MAQEAENNRLDGVVQVESNTTSNLFDTNSSYEGSTLHCPTRSAGFCRSDPESKCHKLSHGGSGGFCRIPLE